MAKGSVTTLPSMKPKDAKKIARFVDGIVDALPDELLSAPFAQLKAALEGSVGSLPKEGKGAKIRAVVAGNFDGVLDLFSARVRERVDRDGAGESRKSKNKKQHGGEEEEEEEEEGEESSAKAIIPLTRAVFQKVVPPSTANSHLSPFASFAHFPQSTPADAVLLQLGTPSVFGTSEDQWEAVSRIASDPKASLAAVKSAVKLVLVRFGASGCFNSAFARLLGSYFRLSLSATTDVTPIVWLILNVNKSEAARSETLDWVCAFLRKITGPDNNGDGARARERELLNFAQKVMVNGGVPAKEIVVGGGLEDVRDWCQAHELEQERNRQALLNHERYEGEDDKSIEEEENYSSSESGGGEDDDNSDDDVDDSTDDDSTGDDSEDEKSGEGESDKDDGVAVDDDSNQDDIFVIDTAGAPRPVLAEVIPPKKKVAVKRPARKRTLSSASAADSVASSATDQSSLRRSARSRNKKDPARVEDAFVIDTVGTKVAAASKRPARKRTLSNASAADSVASSATDQSSPRRSMRRKRKNIIT